jgi:outer membrane biosynthesis protein TonB
MTERLDDVSTPAGPERLAEAISALKHAQGRDDLIQRATAFFADRVPFVAMLVVAKGVARGWDVAGRGLSRSLFRQVALSLSEPSVFRAVVEQRREFFGALKQTATEHNFFAAIARPLPPTCLVLPVRAGAGLAPDGTKRHGKTVLLIYIDGAGARLDVSALGELLLYTEALGHALTRIVHAGRREADAAIDAIEIAVRPQTGGSPGALPDAAAAPFVAPPTGRWVAPGSSPGIASRPATGPGGLASLLSQSDPALAEPSPISIPPLPLPATEPVPDAAPTEAPVPMPEVAPEPTPVEIPVPPAEQPEPTPVEPPAPAEAPVPVPEPGPEPTPVEVPAERPSESPTEIPVEIPTAPPVRPMSGVEVSVDLVFDPDDFAPLPSEVSGSSEIAAPVAAGFGLAAADGAMPPPRTARPVTALTPAAAPENLNDSAPVLTIPSIALAPAGSAASLTRALNSTLPDLGGDGDTDVPSFGPSLGTSFTGQLAAPLPRPITGALSGSGAARPGTGEPGGAVSIGLDDLSQPEVPPSLAPDPYAEGSGPRTDPGVADALDLETIVVRTVLELARMAEPFRDPRYVRLTGLGVSALPVLTHIFPGPLRLDPDSSEPEIDRLEEHGVLLHLLVDLAKVSPKPVIDAALALLDHPALLKRRYAVMLLGRLPSSEGLVGLIHRLYDVDIRTQFLAVEALKRHKALPEFHAVSEELALSLKSREAEQRRRAALLMGRFELRSGIPVLIDRLNDVDDEVRDAALVALQDITSHDAGPSASRWRQWYQGQNSVNA